MVALGEENFIPQDDGPITRQIFLPWKSMRGEEWTNNSLFRPVSSLFRRKGVALCPHEL